jgi:hypothetical protein
VTPNLKRQIARMAGEFLREAGVLVGVLAPLEWIVTRGSLTLTTTAVIVVVTVPCLVFGTLLGLER